MYELYGPRTTTLQSGPTYPSVREQAIIRGVWTLSDTEINTNLEFILKRRATIREFINLLNTDHSYKHRIQLPRCGFYDISYVECSFTSLVMRDWEESVVISFRKFKNCPLRVCLVKLYSPTKSNVSYSLSDIKPLLFLEAVEDEIGAANASI